MLKVPKQFLRVTNNFVIKNYYVTKFLPLASTPSTPAAPPAKTDTKFSRPVRCEPGKVELGFIPAEWPIFFRPKTGITGFYTFVTTFGIYLISKEHYVMEHEYYGGLSMAILCYLASTRIGPTLASYVDKNIDEYEASWNASRVQERQVLHESIADEEFSQQSMDHSLLVYIVKYENVLLQLENEYRERLALAYVKVRDRLDFQYKKDTLLNHYVQINMVDWVLKEVNRSLTSDYLAQYLEYCFTVLTQMASKQAAAA